MTGSIISGRSGKLQNLSDLDYHLAKEVSCVRSLIHTKARPTSCRCIFSDCKYVSYKSEMRLSQVPFQMGMSNDKDFEEPVSHL